MTNMTAPAAAANAPTFGEEYVIAQAAGMLGTPPATEPASAAAAAASTFRESFDIIQRTGVLPVPAPHAGYGIANVPNSHTTGSSLRATTAATLVAIPIPPPPAHAYDLNTEWIMPRHQK